MRNKKVLLALVATALAVRTQAATIVNDTWQDADRTDPAGPVHSENGVDTDLDGDIESAWYNAGTGATITSSVGSMKLNVPTGSASWTTHFTPEASPVTLANAGDKMTVTWVFTTGTIGALNTSQNFRLALVDTPSALRISSDVAPTSGAGYAGYGMFMNMATTLGNANPFRLMERNAVTSDLLSTSANWAGLANGATTGNAGYANNTQYTYTLSLTRNVASGLDIVSTMTGGTLNNTGTASVSFTDATPNSFSYDTFALRPSGSASTADSLDTTLFKVEFAPAPAPEPTTLAISGLGLLAFGALRRRRR